MDIDKLIERLEAWNEQHLSVVCGNGHFECDYLCENEDCIVVRAATALSTLQAENEKLRAELEQMAACVYYKQGSLCRLGGADPANVCVMGPCPNQVSVWNLLTEMVLCPERLPAWVRPEMAPPAEDTLVLVIASGRPAHGTILDHAVLLAKWYADEGWVLEEYPAYEGPEIHFWAPIPELPEEARG